jgi:hypothetical protein
MSAPSLSNFMSELRKRNVSKPSLYYVEIFPPGVSIKDDSLSMPVDNNRLVSMWCSGATTPQSMIETNDDFIENGIRRKFAFDHDYQNLVLTFYVDQAYDVKYFFDEWKRKIVPSKRNFRYPDEYTADKLNVYIIDQSGKDTYLYEYARVYPKTVQSIELSYASGAAISTFTVEFVFEDVYFSKYTNGKFDESKTSTPKNSIQQVVIPNK